MREHILWNSSFWGKKMSEWLFLLSFEIRWKWRWPAWPNRKELLERKNWVNLNIYHGNGDCVPVDLWRWNFEEEVAVWRICLFSPSVHRRYWNLSKTGYTFSVLQCTTMTILWNSFLNFRTQISQKRHFPLIW